jgi:tetratricopeptide (TPR) repeat protein
VAQHLLGVVLVGLVYVLSRVLFGRRPAFVASLMAATYAVLICFEGRLLFDSLVTFLAFGWLTLVVLLAGTPSWSRYALLGLMFGLICTMRPPFLALAPPLLGYIIWTHLRGNPQIIRCSLSLACAFLVPILIVTARNALVGGDVVLLASQGGVNFYIGNNPASDGYTPSVPEAGGVAWENRSVEHIAGQVLGHPPRPSEVSAFWYGKGWDFIRTEPFAAVKLFLKKFYLFWSHIEVPNNLSYYSFEEASGVLTTLPTGFWLVGSLGLVGAMLAWKDPRARLLVVFLFLYCCVTIAFFVCDRFRLPVVPVLCVLSGYAFHSLLESAKERRWAALTKTAPLVVASVLLVNTNAIVLRTDVDLAAMELRALTALKSRDLQTASELYGRIATLDPENSGAHVNQGIAFWGMGRTDDAARALRAGIGKDPYLAVLNLAQLYFNLQLSDSVSLYAERAIHARPFAPGGYVIAAKNFIVRQDMARAEETLRNGLSACRDDFVYGEYLLAGMYLQRGHLTGADSIYRRVLLRTARAAQPDYMIESEEARFGEDLPTLHAKSLHALGRLFAARQQFDSSEAYLGSAARLLPGKADVWADWGVCLLRMNRLDEADTAMRHSLGINQGNPVTWLNYGTVLARKGELERARGAVARALALKPDFEEARQVMAALKTSRP